jgi:hypothetical protein
LTRAISTLQVDSKAAENKVLDQRFEVVSSTLAAQARALAAAEEKLRDELASKVAVVERELSSEIERRGAANERLQKTMRDAYTTMGDTLENTAKGLKKQVCGHLPPRAVSIPNSLLCLRPGCGCGSHDDGQPDVAAQLGAKARPRPRQESKGLLLIETMWFAIGI